MYNFDIKDDHTYTVENISVHNCYGYQWRHFNAPYRNDFDNILTDKVRSEKNNTIFDIDQVKNVINLINHNPESRRILLTTYNPSQYNMGVLPPCHSVILQFYVQDGYLDMFCYNRSSDLFLGLPFNIASSSLLLMIIAKLTNLIPRYFNLTLGDAHVYSAHVEPALEQIKRMPYVCPKIELPEFSKLEEVEKLTFKDFKIIGYKYYDSIKAPMVP